MNRNKTKTKIIIVLTLIIYDYCNFIQINEVYLKTGKT